MYQRPLFLFNSHLALYSLFLKKKGFGLPPVEALAMGKLVVAPVGMVGRGGSVGGGLRRLSGEKDGGGQKEGVKRGGGVNVRLGGVDVRLGERSDSYLAAADDYLDDTVGFPVLFFFYNPYPHMPPPYPLLADPHTPTHHPYSYSYLITPKPYHPPAPPPPLSQVIPAR